MKSKKGSSLLGVIIIVVLAWGIYSFFQKRSESETVMQEHSNYSSYEESRDCAALEPENPYAEGSGHYAGFEWGENGNSCGGNSNSFIEGCEDYEVQQEAYNACRGK
jgi:hypothetical protein